MEHLAAQTTDVLVGKAKPSEVIRQGINGSSQGRSAHTFERIPETGARILGVELNRAQIQNHSCYCGHYCGHNDRAVRRGEGRKAAGTRVAASDCGDWRFAGS